MSDLVDITGELLHSLCCAITACKELNRVILLLQVASDALLDFNLDEANLIDLGDPEQIQNNIHRLAEITNVSAHEIRAALFSSSFQELAEVLLSGRYHSSLYVYILISPYILFRNKLFLAHLLPWPLTDLFARPSLKQHFIFITVVAPDWLDRFPDESTKQKLFYRWFNIAPAPALLRCLSWHLSSVELLPGHHHAPFSSSRGSLVLPISAHIAAEILTQRFIDLDNSTSSTATLAIREVLEQGLKTPTAAEELAGLLASIPDRAVLLPQSTCPTLQTDVFIPFLTHNLVECVERDGTYAAMVGEVMARIVQRGHPRLVASQIIKDCSNKEVVEAIALLVSDFPVSSALEKLIETVLRVLPHQQQQQQDDAVLNQHEKEGGREEDNAVAHLNFLIKIHLDVQ
jgi:hypothetical protein